MKSLTEDFNFNISNIALIHKYCFELNDSLNCKMGRPLYGLILCISGTGLFSFANRELTLQAGEMLFLPKGISYVASCNTEEPFIHFTANFTINDYSPKTDSFFSQIMNGERIYATDKNKSTIFTALFEKLLSVWRRKKIGYTVISKAILYELMAKYFIYSAHTEKDKKNYERLTPARRILEHDFSQNISVSELSHLCGMSETHFRRVWHEVFASSPAEYRRRRKILLAKDLLLSGEYSISAAASEVGFSDPNYFTRVFRAETGLTPTEFIAQNPMFESYP